MIRLGKTRHRLNRQFDYLRVIKIIASLSIQEFVTSAVNGSIVLILDAVMSPGEGFAALHLKVVSLSRTKEREVIIVR
jgi:Na+/H+-translocating membrane pyrophosphatase